MSLRQYFMLLLDYRDILIYPNEWTMACALMPTNYFVAVVLPSWQIKRVVRLTVCNYEPCVFVTIFSGWKIRLRRLQTIPLEQIYLKRTAQPITSIQPSKYVLEVNLHNIICRPSWWCAVSLIANRREVFAHSTFKKVTLSKMGNSSSPDNADNDDYAG